MFFHMQQFTMPRIKAEEQQLILILQINNNYKLD